MKSHGKRMSIRISGYEPNQEQNKSSRTGRNHVMPNARERKLENQRSYWGEIAHTCPSK